MIVLIESDKGGRMHVYNQFDLDRHIKLGWRVVEDDKPPPIKQRRRRKK